LPRGGALALWRWRETMPLEEVAHRLVTEGVPKVGQSPHAPVIATGAILPRQTDDSRLQFVVNHGTPWSFAVLGAITLLGHELAVPSKHGVWLDDRGPCLQGLLPQLLTEFG
jgi:hypothetical protein